MLVRIGSIASTTCGPSGGAATATISRGYDLDDKLTSVIPTGASVGVDWDTTSGIPEPTIMGAQRYVRGPDGTISSRAGPVDVNVGRDMYGSITTPTATASQRRMTRSANPPPQPPSPQSSGIGVRSSSTTSPT